MSTRQKSFFDQGNNKKPRPYWQRNSKPDDVHRRDDSYNKPKMVATPIAASAATKSKLKAFHFAEDSKTPAVCDESIRKRDPSDKENQVTTRGHTSAPGSQVDISNQPSTQSATPKARKDCPQTPLSRLPLADLIGSTEDPLNRAGLEVTPDERVYWNHSPHSSDQMSSSATPATRRGKKRARSSSPASASQNEVSSHFATKKNLDPLQKSLKTPQADPATDLWNRYAINAGNLQDGPPLPAFAHLIHSPSPHSAGNDGSVLRRSLSGGFEFGASKAKRRRINSGARDGNGHDMLRVQAEDGHDGQESLKMSRVGSLVERIQATLKSRNVTHAAAPSSSSPLPETGGDDMIPPLSPLRRALMADQRAAEGHPGESDVADETHNYEPSDDAVVPPKSLDSSSDYDDDEIDLEMLLNAENPSEARLATGTMHSQLNTAAVEPKRKPANLPGTGSQTSGAAKHNYVGVRIAENDVLNPVHEQDDFDEFEDNYDELAADLEDVVAMYDTQAPSQSKQVEASSENRDYPQVSAQASADQPALKDTTVLSGNAEVFNDGELESEDEFGDDIDFEQLAVQFTPAPGPQTLTPSRSASDSKLRAIKRYLITSVVEGQYQTDKGQSRPEKVLLVQDEKTKLSKAITLRQSWFESPCTPGSYIHLIGEFDHCGQCVINDAQNMIILHPDHLISATVVADSFSCTRRAVLQDRVKATNDANKPQVYGHILHEIFQDALKANKWDAQWLSQTIERIVTRYLESLYEIHVSVPEATDYLTSKMPQLQAWADVFVNAHPRSDAVVKDRNGTQALMSINKLLDVEEHVWSPMFGLKGNIDATVQVGMNDGGEVRTLTVPLEVKTGRNNSNASHNAQTALYTLLLSDRYDIEIAYGILYYLETSEISRIPAMRHEIRHMIMQRNELACYVRHRLELPPMLKSPHLCSKCYAKTPCFIYHKLIDGGDGETSGIKEKFVEVIKHLKPDHQDFFKKWDDLLTKEEKDVLKFRRELWTMLSSEREKLGRCFSNVVIEPGSAYEDDDGPKINRFRYTFVKQKAMKAFSFTDSQITTGEPIVISDEKGHFALANGYVTHVRKGRITVAVDRRLHNARTQKPGFNAEHNQTFAGIMEVIEDGFQQSTLIPKESEDEMLYRLDKDEFSKGMATVRNNQIRIMEKDLFKAQDIRRLVIEGVAPTFKSTCTAYSLSGPASQANINNDQKRAIEKVMSAKDYALVLGMPGTGKTTTIAHIIRALVSQGKSVLLTSYTHTAVDNILLKIRRDGINILRLGAVAKVHPEVQEFATLACAPKKTMEELHASYEYSKVVATTCLGVNHPIFNQRVFDYCIVDEASQITLPVCLGPIRMAKTFILVGDHYQLPPLVQNKEAQEGGLDISLFKLLSEKHPSSVVNLEHQYRMCEDIMTLSNTLIYNGRLKCGTEEVAKRSISIPTINALKQHHHLELSLSPGQKYFCLAASRGNCWLRDLLDPSVKACFINTDPLLPASREEAKGSRIVNPAEATLCTQLVESLLTCGVVSSDIGVITLYRSQLALIKQNLRHRAGVEMHTADKFQGRDKEVVILSLVRSNEQKNVGDLLKDWRRVNVAFTRARTKLLILGSRETLASNELLRDFMALMDEKGWRYDLPKGALEGHVWEDGWTQPTGKMGTSPRKETNTKKRGSPKAKRVPEKVGKVDGRAILGNRPVLRDIVNDAS